MRYLPPTMRLEQQGIIAIFTGLNDYHDGNVALDFHGLLGKYEKEEELMAILVNAFNDFMILSNKIDRGIQ